MQETEFVKTLGLSSDTCIKAYEEVRKWLPDASVYVRVDPSRIVVCRNSIATVIEDGDVFSLVQREGRMHDIINHSDKRDSVYVAIESKHFLIETFIAKAVDNTEKTKYRLTCLTAPELSRDFDDYASLSNMICYFLWDAILVEKRLITL